MENLDSRARTAVGSGPARLGSAGAISPELALVDPDAAAVARAALPDRPWDIALDRARFERREPSGVRIGRDEFTAPPYVPIRHVRPRRRGYAGSVRRLAFMVVWALTVTGITLLVEVRPQDVPAFGTSEEAGAPSREAHLPTPVPRGGYVIGARSGFRVGAQGRSLGKFTLPVACMWGAPLGRVGVHADGTFSFRGFAWRVRGGRVRVWLSGRFTGPRRAVGSVTVHGPGCVWRPVPFVARLS